MLAPSAHAEEPGPAPPTLAEYLNTLSRTRLLAVEGGTEAQLTAMVAEGEQLLLAGQYDGAATILLEAVESPRFADFHDFDSYAAAEHMAASALQALGSRKTARRYLMRVIARGPKSPYYGPAVRRYVDVALELGDPADAALFLRERRADMPQDARDELAYLEARAAELAGDDTGAAQNFLRVSPRSRFHASAQYLLGVMATRSRKYAAAERRFCAVAGPKPREQHGFSADARYFEVLDLARLALGRTAHERGRGRDAFYYYFQVPQDSPRLSTALFEAAWASYEGNEPDTSIDLLDQLDARFPESAYADEAAVLRGYVSLARCDFERADAHFKRVIKRFAAVDDALTLLLENPVRRADLVEDLLRSEHGALAASPERRTLIALLHVDPEFYRLHEELGALDAEAARAFQLAPALAELKARLDRKDAPAPAAPADANDEAQRFDADLEVAFNMARGLGEQLDALRAAKADARAVAELEHKLAELARRIEQLADRSQAVRAGFESDAQDAAAGSALGQLLARDQTYLRMLPIRVAQLRRKLVSNADALILGALTDLHGRLRELLRNADIGRIDAVMGSKRRIETQIETLSAGRVPVELHDPLRTSGLLADDEEYWPFEGEDWPDEYKEHYDVAPAKPAVTSGTPGSTPEAGAEGGSAAAPAESPPAAPTWGAQAGDGPQAGDAERSGKREAAATQNAAWEDSEAKGGTQDAAKPRAATPEKVDARADKRGAPSKRGATR